MPADRGHPGVIPLAVCRGIAHEEHPVKEFERKQLRGGAELLKNCTGLRMLMRKTKS
ncbi:MAG: hypothetical protein ACLRL6_09090 [Clostridium sp.]